MPRLQGSLAEGSTISCFGRPQGRTRVARLRAFFDRRQAVVRDDLAAIALAAVTKFSRFSNAWLATEAVDELYVREPGRREADCDSDGRGDRPYERLLPGIVWP